MYSLSVPKENTVEKNTTAEELKRLMDMYSNDVLRTSYMYLKDKQRAEDAFQEVFIRVFKYFGGFKGDSTEKTWIIKITINVCKDMLRSSWLKRVLLIDSFNSDKSSQEVESTVIKSDENRLLYNAVLSLPHVYKDVVILYYYQGYDTIQISKILKVAEGTVRSRLSRSRQRLGKLLEGRLDFGE